MLRHIFLTFSAREKCELRDQRPTENWVHGFREPAKTPSHLTYFARWEHREKRLGIAAIARRAADAGLFSRRFMQCILQAHGGRIVSQSGAFQGCRFIPGAAR